MDYETARPFANADIVKRLGYAEDEIYEALPQDLEMAINYVTSHLKNKSPDFCVGTGGNFESMLNLGDILLGNEGNSLSLKQLHKILHTIEQYAYRDRVKKIGLKPDRADVIVPAMQLTLYLLGAAHCKKIIIPKVGLRDGLLLCLREQLLSKPNRGSAWAVRAN